MLDVCLKCERYHYDASGNMSCNIDVNAFMTSGKANNFCNYPLPERCFLQFEQVLFNKAFIEASVSGRCFEDILKNGSTIFSNVSNAI